MKKLDLITGFLASGKTTFLKKYVKYLKSTGLKVGILEYDHGAVNVDMMLLAELRDDMCELESVAAACDADCLIRRFKTKLISMAMSGYDRVIVEPSGIFDMDEFFDICREEPLDRFYEIGSVITIVSSKLEDQMSKAAEFMLASQAVSAGKILLSRTQLSTEKEIENTKNHVVRAARDIKCDCSFEDRFIEKAWDAFDDEDFKLLMNCGYRVSDYIKLIAGDKEYDFSSVSILKPGGNLDTIKNKINELFTSDEYGDIFRIKGFVFDSGLCYQVNASKTEMTVEETRAGQPVIMVIGSKLDQEKIQKIFK